MSSPEQWAQKNREEPESLEHRLDFLTRRPDEYEYYDAGESVKKGIFDSFFDPRIFHGDTSSGSIGRRKIKTLAEEILEG